MTGSIGLRSPTSSSPRWVTVAIRSRLARPAALRIRLGVSKTLGVGPALEELVLARVDDEKIRLVAGQLGHQPLDPVAGVADRPGVDHLPFPRWVGLGQERAEPAGERGVIEERPAVGRRAAQADDPVGAWRLVPGKSLVVERLALARDDGDDLLARGIGLDLEVGHLGRESRVGIAAVEGRLDAAGPECQFQGDQDPQDRQDCKRQLLPEREFVSNGRNGLGFGLRS